MSKRHGALTPLLIPLLTIPLCRRLLREEAPNVPDRRSTSPGSRHGHQGNLAPCGPRAKAGHARRSAAVRSVPSKPRQQPLRQPLTAPLPMYHSFSVSALALAQRPCAPFMSLPLARLLQRVPGRATQRHLTPWTPLTKLPRLSSMVPRPTARGHSAPLQSRTYPLCMATWPS